MSSLFCLHDTTLSTCRNPHHNQESVDWLCFAWVSELKFDLIKIFLFLQDVLKSGVHARNSLPTPIYAETRNRNPLWAFKLKSIALTELLHSRDGWIALLIESCSDGQPFSPWGTINCSGFQTFWFHKCFKIVKCIDKPKNLYLGELYLLIITVLDIKAKILI